MGEHIQELGDALINDNRFRFKILGFQIKQIKEEKQAKNKMYKLFLKLIDKDSAKKLMQIDLELSKAIQEFENRTGWTVQDHGVYLRNDFSTEEIDYNSSDVFCIRRNSEYGFYLPPEDSDVSYSEDRKRCGEKEFYFQNVESLYNLHCLFSAKEEILNGNYILTSYPVNIELLNMITDYLGIQSTNKFQESTMSLRKKVRQKELQN